MAGEVGSGVVAGVVSVCVLRFVFALLFRSQ